MHRFLSLALLLTATAVGAAEPGRISLSTCPGQGYVGYSYPAIGSCPCRDDRCFHPGRYYACGDDADSTYKKSFWKRWCRAHFCGGSMLNGVPCQCISPPSLPVAASAAFAGPSLQIPPVPEAPIDEASDDITPAPITDDPFDAPPAASGRIDGPRNSF